MSQRVLPEQYEYTCDCCGKVELLLRKPGRPPYWVTLRVAQDAYDYQGAAVADGSFERLLCRGCAQTILSTINATSEALRAASLPPAHEVKS